MIFKGSRQKLPTGYKFHTRSVHDHALKVSIKPKVRKDPHYTTDNVNDIIEKLIASGRYDEDDRGSLEMMTGRTLQKMLDETPSKDEEPEAHEEGEPKPDDETDVVPSTTASVIQATHKKAQAHAHMHAAQQRASKVITFNSMAEYNQFMLKQKQSALHAQSRHLVACDADEAPVLSTKDIIMASHPKAKR